MGAFLEWPDCRNVRDLGTVAGIRPGTLIRSDNLDQLTPEGIAAVHAANVSRIVDLRTAGECETYPSPFAALPLYCHRTLISELRVGGRPVPLLQDYVDLLRLEDGRYIADALEAIVSAPAGAVVVHCHAGKDRTGLVVALALSVAGIGLDAIADDYALTAARLELSAEHSAPETLVAALESVGDVPAYLTRAGLRPDRQRALRERLT